MIGFSTMLLTAQNKYSAETNGNGTNDLIIPIHVLLQNAASGRIMWQPDWPPNIPVDAFNILNDARARDISAVTLVSGGLQLSARRDEQGLLTEFPVFMNGVFYQFKTRFDSRGRISGFVMEGESPVEIQFLAFENSGGRPSLARIHNGGTWLFASLSDQNGLALETWYDASGTPLAVFSAQSENGVIRFYKYAIQNSGGETAAPPSAAGRIPPAVQAANNIKVPTVVITPGSAVRVKILHYDSMGNATQAESEQGVFGAVYNGRNLYYWQDPASRKVSLQWDGRGLLVRMSGVAGDNAALDYRYEYIVDNHGVWIERREFSMEPRLGVLIPVAGGSFIRKIEYRR
jgi:hypothetical protein